MSTWQDRAKIAVRDVLSVGNSARWGWLFVSGARWQREALLTPEAVERAARALLGMARTPAGDAPPESERPRPLHWRRVQRRDEAMSDDRIKMWLDRTQAIAEKATPGPWEAWGKREGGVWIKTDRDEVLHHDRRGAGHLSEDYSWMLPADAEFIAHARTALPAAVAALRAVLRVHWPDEFGDAPGEYFCNECQRAQMNGVWPCPTIQAIQDTLGET